MDSKDYFDQVAHQWDRMRENLFSDAVREKALLSAEVQADKLAADIGSGTGFITEGLIQRGLKVIAMDQSEAMLAEMKRKFASFDEDKIDYRLGESQNLPIAETTVDYVFANMYLHHVESPPIAIKEMVRILKPGGKLVITDLDEHNFEFLRTELHDRWLGFKRDNIRRWFTKSGLKNVIVDGLGENCCASSIRENEKQYASLSIFVALGEK